MIRRVIIFAALLAGAIVAVGGLWLWGGGEMGRREAEHAAFDRKGAAFIRTPGAEERVVQAARAACRCARTGGGDHNKCWKAFERLERENGGSAVAAPVHPISVVSSCYGPLDPSGTMVCVTTEYPVWKGPALCTEAEYEAVDMALKAAPPKQVDAEAVRLAREYAEEDRP